MKFSGVLLAVTDMEHSKVFYRKYLHQDAIIDYGIYLIAGLGNRFHWDRLFYAGIILYLLSCIFTTWPILEK